MINNGNNYDKINVNNKCTYSAGSLASPILLI